MLKALIVDDENRTRQFLNKHLPWSELGYESIQLAEDGAEALELAVHSEPDLILTDIRMPRMGGIELAGHIRELLPGARIIFLSAYSDKALLKSAIHLQAVDYIEKPIDLQEVEAAISRTTATIEAERRIRESAILTQTVVLDLCSTQSDFSAFAPVLRQHHFPLDGSCAVLLAKASRAETLQNLAADLRSERGGRPFSVLYAPTEPRTESAILLLGHSDPQPFAELPERLRRYMDRSADPSQPLFLALGPTADRLSGIPASFKSALGNLERRFFIGEHGTALEPHYRGEPYSFDDLLPQTVYQHLRSRNREPLVEELDRWLAAAARCTPADVGRIRNGLFAVLLRIDQFVNESHLDGEELHDTDSSGKVDLWQLVASFATLRQAREYVRRLIDNIFGKLENGSRRNEKVDEIIDFVRSRIGDPNLSVNLLARELYVTPSYLCLIFKRHTGTTINQFIVAERMEEVVRRMADSEAPIHEIALSVGYYDPKYFTKVFKKEFGLTPSEYRKSLQR